MMTAMQIHMLLIGKPRRIICVGLTRYSQELSRWWYKVRYLVMYLGTCCTYHHEVSAAKQPPFCRVSRSRGDWACDGLDEIGMGCRYGYMYDG